MTRHGSLEVEREVLEASALGHYGGDTGLLDHFSERLGGAGPGEARTSGPLSLESHLMGFGAERARVEGRVVDMHSFREAAARGEA